MSAPPARTARRCSISAVAARCVLATLALCMLMLCCSHTAWAMVVTAQTAGQHLDGEMTLWRDDGRQQSVEDASVALARGDFAPAQGLRRSRGYSSAAWWFHFTLGNTGSEAVSTYLEYTDGLIGNVTLYTRPVGGQGPWRAQMFSAVQPEDGRPLPTVRPIFEQLIPPSGQVEVMMRVAFDDSTGMAGPIYSDVRVWGAQPFQMANTHELFLLGAMIGIMLLVGFAAMIGFAATRDRTFLYYGLNLLLLTLSFHSATGVWPLLLWNGHFSLTLLFAMSGIYFVCAALFVRNYLRTQEIAPRLDIGLRAIVVTGALGTLLAVLGWPQYSLYVLEFGGVGFLIYILASVQAVRHGVAGAKLFTLAWAVYSVSLTVTWGLRDYGLIEHDIFSYRFIFFGIVLEILLFSMAMALRVAQLRRQKDAAEAAYRLQLEREATELEALVAQRTHELDGARREAEAASRAKGDFLAHVSHEIRTPLTAILGYAERLGAEHALSPQQARWLAQIGDSGDYLLSLIGNVLDVSRLEAGKVDVQETPLSLETLVRQLHGLFGEQASSKGIGFEIHSEAQGWFRLDAGKWRQILVNLIGNAVKFTEEGDVQVRLDHQRDADGRDWLVAEVRDSGPGVPDQEAALIFEAFAQTPTGRRAGGAGLGLAICRDFATLMGGTIALDQRHTGGAFFIVRVPAMPCEAEEEQVHGDIRFDGMTVLVAEDHRINQELLQDMLSNAGARVLLAEDGAEAMDIWRAGTHVDLVLTDFHMPLLSGVQLARGLRKLGYQRRIVLVSAGHSPGESALRDAGIDAWVGKPFSRQALLAALAGNSMAQAAPLPMEGPLDLAHAAAALGYSMERFVPLAEKGLARIGALLIASSVEQDEAARCRHAHSAKGISGQVGAYRLMQVLALLESDPVNQVLLADANVHLQQAIDALGAHRMALSA
ncbi:hybrid sensor histidine kinase/response regulator [Andreprevotia sp. IGB-42]|uniref:hybrid sensor histidine kinase/response regulator n=1 Tax=Andreprevotia sp. IGB-42 TaxID=2497473 RepID=UPI00135C9C6E|nr:hybrid sensor histidine kinase/response regulator [Andreprevotia sp. IGB-42]